MILKIKIVFIFLVMYGTTCLAFSQVNHPDSTYSSSMRLAGQKSYEQAVIQMQKLCADYPLNNDYKLGLGRIYYWSGKTELAKNIFTEVLTNEPDNEDAFDLLIQADISLGNFDDAIYNAESGKKKYPAKVDFYHLQLAIAFEKKEKNKEALKELEQITDSTKEKDVDYLKTQLLRKQKHLISIGYMQTRFDKPLQSFYHLAHVEYTLKLKKAAYVFRVNYGNAFGANAAQFEFDTYQKLGPRNYIYLNGGVSDGQTLFPLFRVGGEFYYDFWKLNTSLGARYLHFNASQVLLITGSLAGNIKSWHIEYRPFVVYQKNAWFSSHILSVRKWFEIRESYIQLELQYGSVPYYYFTGTGFDRINAYRVGMSGRVRLMNNLFIQPAFMYELEEYTPDNFRDKYYMQLIFSQRF